MMNSNHKPMVILEEYVAEESSRKTAKGRNTPMGKLNNSQRSERCLPPIRAASRTSSHHSNSS